MIKHVHAKNFLSFEELNADFPTRGLINIFGRVEGSDISDSNGAGKTAILSLIKWVLWGINDRGGVDDVIRKGSKGGVHGRIQIVDKTGGTIQIDRYRKHPQHKNNLYLRGELEDWTGTDSADTQRRINDRLGIDYDVFARGFVFDGSMSIARMKDTEAKDFFERLIGADFSSWFTKAKVRLAEANTAVVTLDQKVARLEGQCKAILDTAAHLEEQERQWKEQQAPAIDAATAEIARLEQDIMALPKTSQLEQDITNWRERITELSRPAQAAQDALTQRASLEQLRATTKATLSQFGGFTCPTCGQAKTAAVDAQHFTLNQKLDEIEKALASLPDNSAWVLEKYNDAVNALQWANAAKAANDLKRAGHVKARQEAIERKAALEHNPFPALHESNRQKREEVTLARLNAIADWHVAKKRAENLETIVEMFSTKGLRSFVLDIIIPALNGRLGYYLGILTNGEINAVFNTTTKSGSEKFHISVVRANGGTTYESLSQGEKSRLDLCLILAVHEYLRSLVGSPLLFFDELLDGLDATGTERVLGILKAVAQSAQVFVISHNPHVANFTDHVFTVVKTDGISRIEA